jgi:excinuclease ABC subunit C
MAGDLIQERLRELPHKPGVYLFKDRFNRIIYVGKARDLRKRVSQYFHPARRSQADLKTRALVDAVCDLETHVVRSETESLLLEGQLIKQYRPTYNIRFRDDKRFLMVKINLNDPFPRFQLTRLKKDDSCRYFGPFAHSGALKSTLSLIKKKFHLRSCRPLLPGEQDFRHCLDHIIKNCSAPCVGRITRAEYLARVREACAFLEGRSSEMMEDLREQMRQAAAKLDFEKAAMLRNMLDDLEKTTKPQRRFVRELPTTVLPAEDLRLLGDVLELGGPPQVIECFDISNISITHKVASMVVFRHGRPDRSSYRRYRIRSVAGQDDFASMAEAVGRRYSRVLRETGRMPDLILVDGGKGQVGAALRELQELGQGGAPLIGLAKQREEIYRPGERDPLVLPHSHGALRLLQRVRDEAHRFANQYHQLLLKRRMAESVLDECPGVSERKKLALLRHFGSVERVRKANVRELAEVEGVGPKLAEQIRGHFARLGERHAAVPDETAGGREGEVVYVLKKPAKSGEAG